MKVWNDTKFNKKVLIYDSHFKLNFYIQKIGRYEYQGAARTLSKAYSALKEHMRKHNKEKELGKPSEFEYIQV